jgi:hypothetical protein
VLNWSRSKMRFPTRSNTWPWPRPGLVKTGGSKISGIEEHQKK